MDNFIGVDFGGTSVKIGIVSSEGKLLKKDIIAINSKDEFKNIINPVKGWIKNYFKNEDKQKVKAIGVGTPGFIDKRNGVLVSGSENIPMLKGHAAAKILEDFTGIPAYQDNDGTCAAAGELMFGKGKKYKDFVMITLGTGIGGGLVLNGKIYRGAKGFAGEIGHMCLDPNGVWCNCGSRGCFEQYASGPAMVSNFENKLIKRNIEINEEITPKYIFETANLTKEITGEIAKEVIEDAGLKIAQAFGTLLNILNLEAFIIGGGISKSGELLLPYVKKHLPDFVWPELGKDVDVMIAELQNNAGIMGAAAMAYERLGS
ncbi:MAG: ROK family protein [Spirochaetales bacterium]|nr:ROK family protein [Spirochaetales bacterium]